MTAQVHPRIYVASLSDYNDGRLHGVWIDATDDLDTIRADVQTMLAASASPGAEEFAIHDYEGFGPLHLDEYENLETIHQLAEGIDVHGEAFAWWADYLGSSAWDELDRFDDAFMGRFDSVADYAADLLDACGIDPDPQQWAPEIIAPYVRFDLDGFAADLHHHEVICEGQDGVYVFAP